MVFTPLSDFFSFLVDKSTPLTLEGVNEVGTAISGYAGFLALGTIIVLILTNSSRAREATTKDFYDQLRWATENLNNEDLVIAAVAQDILENYAKKKPWSLRRRDHKIAVRANDLINKLTDVSHLDGPTNENEQSEKDIPSSAN